ncbi:hypothetical protein NONI108955_35960 [Nocardia ninae]
MACPTTISCARQSRCDVTVFVVAGGAHRGRCANPAILVSAVRRDRRLGFCGLPIRHLEAAGGNMMTRLHAAQPCPARHSSGRSADRIGVPGEAMSRTGLAHLPAQKPSAAMLFALAAMILVLAGCSSVDQPTATRTPLPSATTTPAPTSGPLTPTRSAPSPGQTAPPQAAAAPQGPTPDYVECTDRVDYTGDPRANAEINTIGEQTGTCPEPQRPTPTPVTTSETPTVTTSSTPPVTTSNSPEPTPSTTPATSTVTPPTS